MPRCPRPICLEDERAARIEPQHDVPKPFRRQFAAQFRRRVRRDEHDSPHALRRAVRVGGIEFGVEHAASRPVHLYGHLAVRRLDAGGESVLHPGRRLHPRQREKRVIRRESAAGGNLHRLQDEIRHEVVVACEEVPGLGVVCPVERERHRSPVVRPRRVPAADHILVLDHVARRPHLADALRRRVHHLLVRPAMRRQPVHHPWLYNEVAHRRRLVVPRIRHVQRRRVALQRE